MSIFETNDAPLLVTVLVFSESSMMSVASALDPMRAANRLNKQPCFFWRIVTIDNRTARTTCGLGIEPTEDLDLTPKGGIKGDLLLMIGGFNPGRFNTPPVRSIIRELVRRHDTTCAVESAPWVLARCGLLENKNATTHWEDLEDFSHAFRNTKVKSDRFVIDGSIITTGGASPTFDLMLLLIKSRFGYPLGIDVSSAFIYRGEHYSDDVQQHLSLGTLKVREPRVAKAIEIMETHIDDPVSICTIAEIVHLSPRQLENLFSSVLDSSPSAYYRHLRLQAAARLVLNTNLDIQEITLRTGFISLSAFSRAFKQYFSLSPLKLRKQKRIQPSP